MLGFRLLWLGLFGLAKKFPQAMGVSLVPGFIFYFGNKAVEGYAGLWFNYDWSFWFTFVGFFVLLVPFLSWASINWHRVWILGEFPPVFPRFKDWAWARYTVRLYGLLIGFVAVQFGIFYGIDLLLTGTRNSFDIEIIIGIVALGIALVDYLGCSWIMMRLLPCLSAIAVGDHSSFKQSWSQTAGYTAAIIVISFSMLLIIIGLSILIESIVPYRFVGWPFIVWIMFAMYVAVVTEFYSFVRAQNDVVQVFE